MRQLVVFLIISTLASSAIAGDRDKLRSDIKREPIYPPSAAPVQPTPPIVMETAINPDGPAIDPRVQMSPTNSAASSPMNSAKPPVTNGQAVAVPPPLNPQGVESAPAGSAPVRDDSFPPSKNPTPPRVNGKAEMPGKQPATVATQNPSLNPDLNAPTKPQGIEIGYDPKVKRDPYGNPIGAPKQPRIKKLPADKGAMRVDTPRQLSLNRHEYVVFS